MLYGLIVDNAFTGRVAQRATFIWSTEPVDDIMKAAFLAIRPDEWVSALN